MIQKMSALVKLIGICTFLWVLALQADHSADQVLDSPHTGCLICKSAGEPLSAQDAIPALIPADYSTTELAPDFAQDPAQTIEHGYFVRGPPALS